MPRFKMRCDFCNTDYETLLQQGMSIEKSLCPFCREPGLLVEQVKEDKIKNRTRLF